MQRLNVKALIGCVSLALASGCAPTSVQPAQPATVTALSTSQKQQLETVISDWFGGVKVTLADNAFTDSSSVSIERREHLDNQGNPIEGRHNNAVYSFSLLKQGQDCWLQNERTSQKVLLNGITCDTAL
ncbi:hypothetical protein [Alteromonas lipolytica]|uniref:Uncharacterized protein n=1 Tax=Alteromonas lipolytica TaxID=1856405 RepID=A0A1E8FJT1_9ALTE|nr:hypothetical protein [Alteromonas lipolytica]OFI36197.1 hypothetical protein BFC17_08725 [Alteromonas lipolytica]GGF78601.1 hypothetical protein GCM10011338_33770 [Alteromonas lipolytica]